MISANARDRILARLWASGTDRTEVPDAPPPLQPALDREARIERLKTLMTAVRAEVHRVPAAAWIDKFKEVAREKGLKRVLYGPESPIGKALEAGWGGEAQGLPRLVPYTEPVETFKDDLFQIEAGITGTRGAVADTGALVLWPSAAEPRLLSLVPPVHVAVLDADAIYDSLAAMITQQHWNEGMPTNALLISGPSKTADIEFVLVYGVHGPQELVVLIRT